MNSSFVDSIMMAFIAEMLTDAPFNLNKQLEQISKVVLSVWRIDEKLKIKKNTLCCPHFNPLVPEMQNIKNPPIYHPRTLF